MHQQGRRTGVQRDPDRVAHRRPLARRRVLDGRFAVRLQPVCRWTPAQADIDLVGRGGYRAGVRRREHEPVTDRSDAIAGVQAGIGKPISAGEYREHFRFTSQFEGAERIATSTMTRDDTDGFGLESQLRAARAISEGRFDCQLVPVEAPVIQEGGERTSETRIVTRDEVPRKTSREALAALVKPVARPDGIHTAGSSSQVADGAAAVLLMTTEKARELGCRPRARVVETCLVGCDPVLMLEGPIPATREVLKERVSSSAISTWLRSTRRSPRWC